MKRMVPLLILLLASPAAAQDRWFWVQHYLPGGPRFDGPYESLAACEAERERVIELRREDERQARARNANSLEIADYRRAVDRLQRQTLCERR